MLLSFLQRLQVVILIDINGNSVMEANLDRFYRVGLTRSLVTPVTCFLYIPLGAAIA
jgi:hypothetical protein